MGCVGGLLLKPIPSLEDQAGQCWKIRVATSGGLTVLKEEEIGVLRGNARLSNMLRFNEKPILGILFRKFL